MANNDRARLVFHGAVVMFVGLLCGYPAVAEHGDETVRLWRAAHLELLLMGIGFWRPRPVIPSLVLARREGAGLVWALLAIGYGLTAALVLGAIPGALLAVLLTLTGARGALRECAVEHVAQMSK